MRKTLVRIIGTEEIDKKSFRVLTDKPEVQFVIQTGKMVNGARSHFIPGSEIYLTYSGKTPDFSEISTMLNVRVGPPNHRKYLPFYIFG